MHTNGHILLFPFLAQGHLTPFLNLANLIINQHKRYTVTLATTPLNILTLRSSLPQSSPINLAELPFCSSDHGLPPNCETTEGLTRHQMKHLFLATDSLRPPFDRLLETIIQELGDSSKLCIVADFLFGWTTESAKIFSVSHAVLITCGAYSFSVYKSLWLHPPTSQSSGHDDDEQYQLVDLPEVQVTRFELESAVMLREDQEALFSFVCRTLSQLSSSGGALVNTVKELEEFSHGLDLLRRSIGIPVWPIGPLVRVPRLCIDDDKLTKFLDSKPEASVVYVSFGSQSSIPAPQMIQLAIGLEQSNRPFVWVIRPPFGFEAKEEFRREWLPDGFVDRMIENKRGLLVHGWAPQVEILAHRATGVFVSHCGWNSVVESLSRGVPIIGWPLIADQLYSSRMLRELGVCVEVVVGGQMRGSEEVKEAIELALGENDKAMEMRRKVGEIGEVIEGALMKDEEGECMGSSIKALEDFLHSSFSNG